MKTDAISKTTPIYVLHVDDDRGFLELSKQILIDLGNFEFDNACCVDEAFKKLSTNRYDIIVSDYEMPQKNGLQFLQELRNQNNDIPFILFTGKSREEVAIEALNLGADGYFDKQGNPETVYGELKHGIMQLVSQKRISDRLLTDEERFRQLFSNTPMAVAIYEVIDGGENFVFKDFNSAAEKIEKTNKAEVIDKRVTEIFPGFKTFGILEVFKRVWKTGQSEYFPDAFYQDNQNKGTWRENWVIKLSNDNIACMYNNITERKLAEEALIESEANYKNLINSMMESTWVIDFEGNFIDVNDAAIKMLGYSKEELKSLGIKGIDKDLSRDQIRKLFSSMPADGNQVFETIHTTKDGTKIPVEISSSLVNYQGKKLILSVARNITDRKKAERKIEEDANLRKTLLDNIPCIALILEKKTHKIVASNKIAQDAGAVPGKTCYGTCANGSIPCSFCLAPKLWATGKKQVLEEVEHNGKYYRGIWLPYNEDLYVHYIFDTTKEKQAEDLLKESAAKYRDFAESLPEIVFEIDDNGNFSFVNQRASQITGYKLDELTTNFSFIQLVIPAEQEKAKENIGKLMSGASNSGDIFHLVRKNGSVFPAMVWASPCIVQEKVVGIRGIVVDISERYRQEMELKKTQDMLSLRIEELEKLMDVAPVALWISQDPQCKSIVGNRKANQFYEAKPGENVSAGSTNGEDQDFTRRYFKNGKELKPQELPMQEATSQNMEIRDSEFEVLLPSGKKITLFGNASPLLDDACKVRGCVGSFLDISERKTAEHEVKRNHRNIQVMNDKLRVAGGLTRHDVSNKLAAIGFYEFLLRKSLGDKPELAKYLDGIKNAIDESSNLFELSGFYEKIEIEKLSSMDVFECFNVAAALFSNLITLKVVNECQGLKVVADSLLKQLFYNLIDNSLKHGEKVTQIRLHYNKDDNGIQLFFEDNGVGIPKANKLKLFKVGFTTGKGSGLGLYLIEKIIEVYGWTIQETGESDKGAKFVITIPKINSNEKENYYIKK